MNLHVFSRAAQQDWINTGYRFVKLSASENVGFQESFTLMEPYFGEEVVRMHPGIVPIQSAKIDQIIREQTGKYAR